ncbi:MAG TPA: hypothetical protein VJN50_09725 [Actinomycetota bacterium]|nr:hypothetical protein [Actinomycetota bacterium]
MASGIAARATARGRAWLDRILATRVGRFLDPYFDIGLLRRLNPLLALVPMGIMLLLGLQRSEFGHMDTVPNIFPIVSFISALNPLAGLLSAMAYGLGDTVQKLVADDTYYVARSAGDFWGARGGYLVAYSSLALFGVLPGVLARVGRQIGPAVARMPLGRRAQGAELARGVELASAAIGASLGAIGGGVVAATAYKTLVAPAYLWRPSPDTSCYLLSKGNVSEAIPQIATASGLGGAGTAVVPRAPSKAPREPAEETADPCANRFGKMENLAGEINALNASMQEMTRIRNVLDMEWSNTVQSSYYSGVIDVGFLAGSVWKKLGEAAVGDMGAELVTKWVSTDLIANRFAAAAVKALGKEVTKDLSKAMLDQEISWSDLVSKPIAVSSPKPVPMPEGAGKKWLQEKLTEILVRRRMQEHMGMGLHAGGEGWKGYDRMRKVVESSYAKPLADKFGEMLSVLSMGMGVYSGAKKAAMLREKIGWLSDQISELQLRFEDALNEHDVARDSYQRCRERNPLRGGV